MLRFGETQLALQVTDGSVAGGRLAGELVFLRDGEGLIARSRIGLTGANAAELLPGDGVLSGRLTLDLTTEGAGMSAVALVGSLSGNGTFTLENGRLVRLDPAAFDAVIRAVDQGLPIDVTRVRDRMDAALARGVLAVPLAEGAITINAGQAQLSNTTVRAQRADLAVSGSVNLAENALDARLTLLGAGGPGAPANTRPEVLIALKGPVDTPKRTIDVAALASWLALRAVEQQSKKLDVLEGRAPAVPPTPAAVNANAPVPPAQNAPAARRRPGRPRGAPAAGGTQRAKTQAGGTLGRPASAASAADRHPSSAGPARAAGGAGGARCAQPAAPAEAGGRRGAGAPALAIRNIVRPVETFCGEVGAGSPQKTRQTQGLQSGLQASLRMAARRR